MNLAKVFQILDVADPGYRIPSGSDSTKVILFIVFGAVLAGAIVGVAFLLRSQGKKQDKGA